MVVALLSLDVDDTSQRRHNVLIALCKVYSKRFYDTDRGPRSSSKIVDTAEYLNSSSGWIACCAVAPERSTMIEPFEGSQRYFAPPFDLQPSFTKSLQEPRLRLLDRNEASVASSHQFLPPLPIAKTADSSGLRSLWPVSAIKSIYSWLHHELFCACYSQALTKYCLAQQVVHFGSLGPIPMIK